MAPRVVTFLLVALPVAALGDSLFCQLASCSWAATQATCGTPNCAWSNTTGCGPTMAMALQLISIMNSSPDNWMQLYMGDVPIAKVMSNNCSSRAQVDCTGICLWEASSGGSPASCGLDMMKLMTSMPNGYVEALTTESTCLGQAASQATCTAAKCTWKLTNGQNGQSSNCTSGEANQRVVYNCPKTTTTASATVRVVRGLVPSLAAALAALSSLAGWAA